MSLSKFLMDANYGIYVDGCLLACAQTKRQAHKVAKQRMPKWVAEYGVTGPAIIKPLDSPTSGLPLSRYHKH